MILIIGCVGLGLSSARPLRIYIKTPTIVIITNRIPTIIILFITTMEIEFDTTGYTYTRTHARSCASTTTKYYKIPKTDHGERLVLCPKGTRRSACKNMKYNEEVTSIGCCIKHNGIPINKGKTTRSNTGVSVAASTPLLRARSESSTETGSSSRSTFSTGSSRPRSTGSSRSRRTISMSKDDSIPPVYRVLSKAIGLTR